MAAANPIHRVQFGVARRCFMAIRVLRLSELARMLVRFDHIASVIVNANHGIM